MFGFVFLALIGFSFAFGGFFDDDDDDKPEREPDRPDSGKTFTVDDGETVTGTEAGDIFNLVGAGTALGAGGGDVFDLSAPGAEARGGAGGDRFEINAAGTTSFGEQGGDRFVTGFGLDEALKTEAIGGPGNDAFALRGATIGYGGPGDDSFSLSGNTTGGGGTGADDFSNVAGNSVAFGGPGNDNFTNITGNGLANGGAGDDIFRSINGDGTAIGGAGSDVFGVETGSSANVRGGADGDLILYANPSQFYDNSPDASTSTGGGGADLFVTRMFDSIEDNDVQVPNVITDFDPREDILGVIPPPSGNTQLDTVEVTPGPGGNYTDVRLNFLDDSQANAIQTSQLFRLMGQSDFDPSLIRVFPNLGPNAYDYSYQDVLDGAEPWTPPSPPPGDFNVTVDGNTTQVDPTDVTLRTAYGDTYPGTQIEFDGTPSAEQIVFDSNVANYTDVRGGGGADTVAVNLNAASIDFVDLSTPGIPDAFFERESIVVRTNDDTQGDTVIVDVNSDQLAMADMRDLTLLMDESDILQFDIDDDVAGNILVVEEYNSDRQEFTMTEGARVHYYLVPEETVIPDDIESLFYADGFQLSNNAADDALGRALGASRLGLANIAPDVLRLTDDGSFVLETEGDQPPSVISNRSVSVRIFVSFGHS